MTPSPGLTALQAEQAALTASVAKNTSVVGSVQTAFAGLSTQISNLAAQIAASNSEDPAVAQAVTGLQELQATLDANTVTLAAAVAANTPTAGQPTTAPSPPVIATATS